MELPDKALGPQNVLESSRAIYSIKSQRDLGADGQIHD